MSGLPAYPRHSRSADRISVLQDNGGAHPLVMDALAEMSEAQMQMRLTRPPVRAQAILLPTKVSPIEHKPRDCNNLK